MPCCMELPPCDNTQFCQRDELFKAISAVFQDIWLLPVSVYENIALKECDEIEKKKINEVLRAVGLYDKVNSLSAKGETKLMKSIYDDIGYCCCVVRNIFFLQASGLADCAVLLSGLVVSSR